MEETGEPVKQTVVGFAAALDTDEPTRQLLSTDSHIAVPTIVLVSHG